MLTLQEQARALHLELGEYLQLLADGAQPTPAAAEPTLHEFETLLDQVSEGVALRPTLPPDSSRSDIYAGHD